MQELFVPAAPWGTGELHVKGMDDIPRRDPPGFQAGISPAVRPSRVLSKPAFFSFAITRRTRPGLAHMFSASTSLEAVFAL